MTLEAFIVGDIFIEFGGLEFGGGEGNIIIDSGSTITFLPYDIYNKIESAVAEYINLERVVDPNNRLNLCYNVTHDASKVPLIIAHFKAADVKLYSYSTFINV